MVATTDLRAARRAAGLSQQELAQRAGCSIAYLRLLERGFAPDRSTVLPRIVHALDPDSERAA